MREGDRSPEPRPTYHARRGFLQALGGASMWPFVATPPRVDARSNETIATAASEAVASRLAAWRSHFPALAQQVSGRPLAYLDNAATTLRPREVIDALVRFYEGDNANPSASLHTLARRAAAALDAARTAAARFVNAASSEEIVFTRGATEGINLVAATWGVQEIRSGDEIIVTIAEHASNLFPWQRLARDAGARLTVVDVDAGGRLRLDQLESALTARTRLVAVAHVSNVLGIVNPVATICELAHRRGAAVLVDAAQSAPHVRLDLQTIGCDFLVFSSHKLLGPMGVGVLWAHGDRLRRMPPYHVGSNMAHGLALASATPESGALRFQAGTPDVAGPVGLARALALLESIGFEALGAHDEALAAYALSRLRAIPGVRLLGDVTGRDRVPVISFTVDGIDVPTVVRAADAAGIALRGGDLAALPLLQRFGVSAAARLSAYVYNTTGEIDRLLEVLSTLRPHARHRLEDRPRQPVVI